jgi:hypothetical protein
MGGGSIKGLKEKYDSMKLFLNEPKKGNVKKESMMIHVDVTNSKASFDLYSSM